MSLLWNTHTHTHRHTDTHTHTHAHTRIFSMTFYCGECTSQTSGRAFVGRRCDALLLRRWMDECHREVKAALSSRHHSALAVGATGNSGQNYCIQTTSPSPYITPSSVQCFSFPTPAPFHAQLCLRNYCYSLVSVMLGTILLSKAVLS